MFFAAKEGEAEIVQLLLQRGADLRTVDKVKPYNTQDLASVTGLCPSIEWSCRTLTCV